MDYYMVEDSLQALLEQFVPLSAAQIKRLHQICIGVLLAGKTHLTAIARWLKQVTQQDSRVQWLRRSLGTEYLSHERVYRPFVQQALAAYRAKTLHIVIDRTHLEHKTTDLLSISLSFRKRAIPLIWKFVPYGSTGYATQIELIEACRPLLPENCRILFHGDSEFSAVPLMQHLNYIGWDFIIGQRGPKHYRIGRSGTWQALNSLPVSKTRACYLEDIELTKTYAFGPLNLFAFYQPHYAQRTRKRDVAYCVTSLPITPALRRLGHRRWGIECCFKDFKSSGWQLHLSDLNHPERREGLLTVLSLSYLWATCLGRWLCKTGKRKQVDAKTQRHLSLFRIGWDWLVHHYNMDLPCPTLLTLYQ